MGCVGRDGAGVHGRRPVDRPGGAAAVGRSAAQRALRPGDRQPAGPRFAGGPRREARVHLALLQPDPARHLAARFSDAQCGFKAIRRDVATELLPLVEDNGWFFDTELLVLAQRCGLRIHEVPVDWVDDPDSRVDITATAIGDLKGVARLVRGFATGSIKTSMIRRRFGRRADGSPGGAPTFGLQVLRFGAIGIASTIAYAALFLLFRQPLGSQMANFVALCLTAIGNTAANRRITFGVHGTDGVLRHQLQGLLVFLLGLALTSGSLALLSVAWATAPASIELTVLILANLVTTVGRFLAFRLWVFPNSRAYTEIGTSP